MSVDAISRQPRLAHGSGYLGNRCAHGPFVHTPSQGVAYNHANIFGNERCVMMEPMAKAASIMLRSF
jgi:hypothetical protein